VQRDVGSAKSIRRPPAFSDRTPLTPHCNRLVVCEVRELRKKEKYSNKTKQKRKFTIIKRKALQKLTEVDEEEVSTMTPPCSMFEAASLGYAREK
jgi:hypothetical protein